MEPSQFEYLPDTVFASMMLYLPNNSIDHLKRTSVGYSTAIGEVERHRSYWVGRIEKLLGVGPSEDTYKLIKGINLERVYNKLTRTMKLSRLATEGATGVIQVLLAYNTVDVNEDQMKLFSMLHPKGT